MALRAVFIDKDGTLVENVAYNVDLDRIRLTCGAVPGLRRLVRAGFAIVLISNQSGVARGFFDMAAVERVDQYLRGLLAAQGVPLLASYYCPHYPEGVIAEYAMACDCRKPGAGMLRQAAREHDIDLAASFMVGDILDDVEAGHAAGCHSVLLDVGSETEWLPGPLRTPDLIAADLYEAAGAILERQAQTTEAARAHR